MSEAPRTAALAAALTSGAPGILAEWERRAREIPPGRELDREELLDNFPDFLKRVAEDLERLERGEVPRLSAVEAVNHALSRLANGYEVGEVLQEWVLLRDILLRHCPEPGPEAALIQRAIERGILVSVETYGGERGRALDALDRVSRAALEADGLESLLTELAQALVDGLPSVDGAAILLEEGGELVARAVAGREAERARALRIPREAPIAERLARDKTRPHCVSDTDVPELRGLSNAFRSLCAAPLLDRGELVGIAVVGSQGAFSLSSWDERLFGSMAARAGLAVGQQRLRDALHVRAVDLARSEARARRSVRWLEAVIGAATEGILVVTPGGAVSLANEAAAAIFGVPLAELRTLSIRDFASRFDLRDGEGRPTVALAERALGGSTVGPTEREIRLPDGTMRTLRASAAPLVSGDASVEGAVVVVGDVTALKKSERERESTLAELEHERARLVRANRFRDEILAMVSHDLRNPLGAIVTSAALLERTAPEPAVQRHVDTIRRAARRMAHLIGDLLDTASIEAGRLSIRWNVCAASEILQEAAEVQEPLAKEKGIALERASCRDLRVRCDRERILQVFANLVANAIRFGSAGDKITLSCARESDAARFVVEDTGPGIAEEVRTRLFEPFVSGAEAHGANVGLGLYISREIVRAHGGELDVASVPGEGARFSFTVPVAED